MSWLSNIWNGVSSAASAINPAVGGVLGGIGSIFSGIEAEDQHNDDLAWMANEAQKNRDYQTSERLATQSWNEKMWHMENEYNSPANQLKLGLQAGINPNTLFGSNPFVATSAPSSSPMSGATAGAPNGFASSLLTADAQTQLALAQAQKTSAEAQRVKIDNSFAPKFNETAIKKAEAEIDKIGADKGFTEEQTNQLKKLFPLLKGKNEQELKEMEERVKQAIANTRKADAEAGIAEAQEWQAEQDKNFRDAFGVAPGSGLVDGLIQLIGSGEKGQAIANAMVDTLFNLCIGSISSGWNMLTERIPNFLKKVFIPYANENGREPIIINPYAGSNYDE